MAQDPSDRDRGFGYTVLLAELTENTIQLGQRGIIDKTTLIHVGASLNHLGKKCFAFSSLDKSNIPDILAKL